MESDPANDGLPPGFIPRPPQPFPATPGTDTLSSPSNLPPLTFKIGPGDNSNSPFPVGVTFLPSQIPSYDWTRVPASEVTPGVSSFVPSQSTLML